MPKGLSLRVRFTKSYRGLSTPSCFRSWCRSHSLKNSRVAGFCTEKTSILFQASKFLVLIRYDHLSSFKWSSQSPFRRNSTGTIFSSEAILILPFTQSSSVLTSSPSLNACSRFAYNLLMFF